MKLGFTFLVFLKFENVVQISFSGGYLKLTVLGIVDALAPGNGDK
jgi:hypothetical protein